MATFQAQVTGLTNISISSSGTNPIESELTTFLTDGAKEIINILPYDLKEKCASISIVNATNGTTLDMDAGGDILQVTRLSANSGGYYIPCRQLHPMYGDLTNDSSSLYYASATDPAYWITSNSSGASTLFIKPTTTDAQPSNVYRVAYPSVAYSDSVVANFPNEAEYLVTLYAAIKTLQNAMGGMNSVTAIDTTAFDAIKASVANAEDEIEDANKMTANIVLGVTEIAESAVDTDTTSSEIKTAADAIATALSKFRADGSDPGLFGEEGTYDTDNSEMTRVKDALDKARNLVDGASMSGDTEPESVQYWLADEDTEMAQATLAAAQTEIQRAQTHLAEWGSTVQALKAEADGFAKEIQARGAWTAAKAQVWNGYFASAQAYAAAAQTYLASAQGYLGEAKIRMERENQKYQWYQAQQVKLQQDYDKGIQMLISQGMPQPAQQQGRQ